MGGHESGVPPKRTRGLGYAARLVRDPVARRGTPRVLRCGIPGVIGNIRRAFLAVRPLRAHLPAQEHDDRDQEGRAYNQ